MNHAINVHIFHLAFVGINYIYIFLIFQLYKVIESYTYFPFHLCSMNHRHMLYIFHSYEVNHAYLVPDSVHAV